RLMPRALKRKSSVATRKKKEPPAISDDLRASDDALRESLRTANLRVFDMVLPQAFVSTANGGDPPPKAIAPVQPKASVKKKSTAKTTIATQRKRSKKGKLYRSP